MKKLNVKTILRILDEEFPNPSPPLRYTNAYTLLVAVLLSAQSTDATVNKATKELFMKADNPKRMIDLGLENISKITRPCGFHKKAGYIYDLSRILVQKYGGEVPKTMEELEDLPGIGHKSASVVMSQWYGKAAFPVDTHIHRLAKRWGISSGRNVKETETDCKRFFPKKEWIKTHLQMIYFGRKYCPAKAHEVKKCPICSLL